MIKFIGIIGFICVLIGIKKNLQTFSNPKEKKKILVIGGVLLALSLFMIFSSNDSSEKKYIQEIASIYSDTNSKIKQTDVFSEASMIETTDYLEEQLKKLNTMNVPSSLPQEIKDCHQTFYEGIEKIREGIIEVDANKVQNGQTIIAMTDILYSDYIKKNADKFDLE